MIKLKRIQILFGTLSLLLLIFSCGNDDDETMMPMIEEDNFIIKSEISSSSYPYFISVSNQDGNILLDTVGANLLGDFIIEKADDDQVDITYGFESDFFFNFRTYRDVKSGFLLSSRPITECINSFPNTLQKSSNIEISIDGLSGFSKLYFPAFSKQSIPDLTNNRTILKGRFTTNSDLQITIKAQGELEYKSIVIKESDWTEITEGNFSFNVNFADFQVAEKHEIQVATTDEMSLNATVLTTDQRTVKISNWSNSNDTHDGGKVTMFLHPTINLDQIKIKVATLDRYNGYETQEVFNEIPESINFFKPIVTINNTEVSSYDVNIVNDYNFAASVFEYQQDLFISSWTIYQNTGTPNTFQLPSIPSTFKEQSPIVNAQLGSPIRFVSRVYDTDELSFQNTYYETPIDRQFNCGEYAFKSIDKDF